MDPKVNYVVAAIEISKDVKDMKLDKLIDSLQAHESRIQKSEEGPLGKLYKVSFPSMMRKKNQKEKVVKEVTIAVKNIVVTRPMKKVTKIS